MRGAIIGVMVAVGVILGTLALLFAQGAPTAPGVTISAGLTPGTTESIPFEFTTGYNSISAPNSVWDPNFHLTYSVSVSASNGFTQTVASAQTSGLQVSGQSGTFYTLSASVPLTVDAACSGSACSAITETVTVTSYVTVVTPYKAWFSPTTVATFGSVTNATCTAAAPCLGAGSPSSAPQHTATAQDTFLAELLAPLTFLAGFEFIAAFILVKHPALAYGGIAAVVIGVLEIAVWAGL